MPANADSVHVVLAVYDPQGTYSQHAGVVMTSIFENTQSPVVVHVLHDETLTDDNRKKFIRTAEKYNQTVNLINVEDFKRRIDKKNISLVEKNWSVGALYRLFIPSLLNLDRVIYLDCDIVVKLDIRELWDINLEGNCLGGVKDNVVSGAPHFSYNSICERLNGCSLESYVNSGVLLMDLKRIRERGELCDISMAWISRHRHSTNYADQDALNALFSDSIRFIDPKFNFFLYSRDPENQQDNFDNRITHITSPKPWRELKGLATEQLYWGMFLKSAWGENTTVEELIGILGRTASMSPYIHRHTKQCYLNIGHRLFFDIFHPVFWMKIWVLIRELFEKIRFSVIRKENV